MMDSSPIRLSSSKTKSYTTRTGERSFILFPIWDDRMEGRRAGERKSRMELNRDHSRTTFISRSSNKKFQKEPHTRRDRDNSIEEIPTPTLLPSFHFLWLTRVQSWHQPSLGSQTGTHIPKVFTGLRNALLWDKLAAFSFTWFTLD